MSITVIKMFTILFTLFIPSIFSGISIDNNDGLEHLTKSYTAIYNDTCVISDPLAGQIDQMVLYHNRRLGFHGSVLVVKDGSPIYARSIGYADLKSKERLNRNSSFELASVSKQFTAYAIMMLQERGLIQYDDPIDNYLCSLPFKGVTIRHLLNHTSGVQNYMWLLENKWIKEHAPSNKEVVNFIGEHGMYMNFKAGSRFSYSNTGYVLLAAIIEEVSGKSYGSFIEENIFTPLCMYTASVGKSDSKQLTGFQTGRNYSRRLKPTIHDNAFGDKGIYASIWDLYKWNKEVSNPKLLDKPTVLEAFKPAIVNRRKINYGFGFRLMEDNKGSYIYHHGLWNGFRTTYSMNLDENTTIVVLNHTNSKAKTPLVKRLDRIVNS
ncbi:MAG: beta-lactamase family protein [Chitinophagales bacterium]|nr:beta-lactamase family protein [Chitinophagales bacterium]